MEVIEVAQAVVLVSAQPAPAAAPIALPVAPIALPVAPVALPLAPVAPPVVEPMVQLVPPVVPPPVEHVPTVAPVVRPVAPAPARTNGATPITRRVGGPRRISATGRASSYRFVVRFQAETVIQATDIRDALRQAEAFGAAEVLALSRTL